MKTKTGSFPIGFRRGWSDWQKNLEELIVWAEEWDAEVIDIGKDADTTAAAVRKAGLKIGTADLLEWNTMISKDASTREKALDNNTEYIKTAAETGGLNFFIVMLPEDPSLPARDNFDYMLSSFSELLPVLEQTDSALSVEGWPGPGSLVCTPETFRVYLRQLNSEAAGINYDPSHLIRMNIDPIRFLEEFGEHVVHVHGKDTEIINEHVYECGTELQPVFTEGAGFGSATWRYTIPGNGIMRWQKAFSILKEKEYSGCVSIELEDADFNGAEDGEKTGILQGMRCLSCC